MADMEDIARALRARITAGRRPPDQRPPDALPAGAVLPSVRALAAELGASVQTTTNALAQLDREGLVLRGGGESATVADERPVQLIRWDRFQPSEWSADGSYTVERQAGPGWRIETDYERVGPCAHPPAWALEMLGTIAEDETTVPTWERRRVRWATPMREGRPVVARRTIIGLFTTHIPRWVGDRVPAVQRAAKAGPGGTYARMNDAGIETPDAGIDGRPGGEDISFRMASAVECERFGWRSPDWVCQVDRMFCDENNRPLTADREVWLPGHVRFRSPLKLTGPPDA